MSQQEFSSNQHAVEGRRYLIPETEYGYDHPEVIFWTQHFVSEAGRRNVFANIKAALQGERSQRAAQTLATAWYDFTRHVPTFLTRAVAQTADPERQHHLIQIAYDELGGRNKEFIHSRLFLKAIDAIGVKVEPNPAGSSIRDVIHMLDATLAHTDSEAGIIGLLLSFEIIAEENIETLFDGLCYSEACEASLADSAFFKVHRADETEHIRHSVANFLRFCNTQTEREAFKQSFDQGIEYWRQFWDQCARMIHRDSDFRTCS
jgi:pyrroloquinoline quinone (PQQ) biosynthesis protein C